MCPERTGVAAQAGEQRGCFIYDCLDGFKRIVKRRPLRKACRCAGKVTLAGLRAGRSALDEAIKHLEKDLDSEPQQKGSFRKITIE